MLIKKQIYETIISDYTSEGQGVAHIEGCAVFIPNAIAGERVTVRIEKAQKTWAAGKIVEILEKSPHRVNRECPVAKLCGGCDFWHMDYEEETRLKAERVRNCLNRLGGENLESMSILAAPTCYGYRNKAQYPVSQKKDLTKDSPPLTDALVEKLQALNEVAARRGQSLAEMALAWLLRDERVTSVIVGASSVAQLEKNLRARQNQEFTPEELTGIENILKD